MIFGIFKPEKLANKWAIWTQNTAFEMTRLDQNIWFYLSTNAIFTAKHL
jgi:hypothetical protein